MSSGIIPNDIKTESLDGNCNPRNIYGVEKNIKASEKAASQGKSFPCCRGQGETNGATCSLHMLLNDNPTCSRDNGCSRGALFLASARKGSGICQSLTCQKHRNGVTQTKLYTDEGLCPECYAKKILESQPIHAVKSDIIEEKVGTENVEAYETEPTKKDRSAIRGVTKEEAREPAMRAKENVAEAVFVDEPKPELDTQAPEPAGEGFFDWDAEDDKPLEFAGKIFHRGGTATDPPLVRLSQNGTISFSMSVYRGMRLQVWDYCEVVLSDDKTVVCMIFSNKNNEFNNVFTKDKKYRYCPKVTCPKVLNNIKESLGKAYKIQATGSPNVFYINLGNPQ